MYSSMREESPKEQHAKDFPIICETCLGDNPFIRMQIDDLYSGGGKQCKICDRPFTVYRWRPGPKARFKKTEICKTCAKLKNVCQTCILDLRYGLPVQVRDSVLSHKEKVELPSTDVNRAFALEQYERKLDEGLETETPYSNVKPSVLLNRLAKRDPYYQRNLPHICSFFVKGECNRGDSCPFRHEMPPEGELAKQNIKDRYHGNNDPVAKKILRNIVKSEQEESPISTEKKQKNVIKNDTQVPPGIIFPMNIPSNLPPPPGVIDNFKYNSMTNRI